jgi:DNA-directed RNA polymerase subunit RPC12/RpoP
MVMSEDAIACPGCGHLAPLQERRSFERDRRVGWAALAGEVAGLAIMATGHTGVGVVTMLAAGVLLLTNIQTPTGRCASCGTIVAADWKGEWHQKKRDAEQ